MSVEEPESEDGRIVYSALGANVGNRHGNLAAALSYLQRHGRIVAVSALYETAPWGVTDQPPFLNAACALETHLALPDLLAAVKRIEWELGRRPAPTWGPRPLDIDILLDGDVVLDTPSLTVPHARLAERAFVLAPLADIAAGAIHPVLRRTVQDLLDALPDVERASVVRMSGPDWRSWPNPLGPPA